MRRWRDHQMRVYSDGDVSFSNRDDIAYGTFGGAESIQCNAEHGSKAYWIIVEAARNVAKSMRELDKVLTDNKLADIASKIHEVY